MKKQLEMKNIIDNPPSRFKVSGLLKLLPMETYIFSPLLLGSLAVAKALTFPLPNLAKAILLPIGAIFAGSYFYALKWAKSFPKLPGAFERVDITKPDLYPKAPVQVKRNEVNCKNTLYVLDELGRRVFLRGVNLSGATKVPTTPVGNTFVPSSLDLVNGSKGVSFVGRPCPLEEADEHLARLRSWGLTFLRFLITWEAVEHEGPGIYDEEYLDYLVAFLGKAQKHGISVFIDPHQDVWSRFTGGDGAPSWTLEKVGFDLQTMEKAGCCLTHQNQGEKYSRMHWTTNYFRLVNGTMWTLFFAGNDFAPMIKIEGQTAQDYLQGCYCRMLKKVASKLKNLPNVLGFDTLNEPSNGFLCRHLIDIRGSSFRLGAQMSPWQSILLGLGETIEVDFYAGLQDYQGKITLNPEKLCVWKDGPESCVWKKVGLYTVDSAGNFLLDENKVEYFLTNPSTKRQVDLQNDYAVPFFVKVRDAIQSEMSDAVIFYEPILNFAEGHLKEETIISKEQAKDSNFIYAKHHYNGLTLLRQTFSKIFHANFSLGKEGIVYNLSNDTKKFEEIDAKYLNNIKEEATVSNGQCPSLIGETGIPFNMKPSPWKNPTSFNFKQCDLAMNETLDALDMALVSYTIWNYTPDNTNSSGDLWNIEDLSIFSRDQSLDKSDIHAGGRSLGVIVRPYAFKTAGVPVKMEFDAYVETKPFYYEFEHDAKLTTAETLIFLPSYQYPGKQLDVEVSDGEFSVDWENQTLVMKHDVNSHSNHWIKVSKA
eukprot:augustus_masked-scaffold_8-processed-gene-6.61-mRNA-1 protein AED:0.01 eAED:0.01 QI:0/-1/0/1/-1/1/1/0/761